MVVERLQKILAHAGVASRRTAEELILDGRVRVNGKTIRTLGAKADSWRDKIEVDNRPILTEKPVYFLFHKPRGVVTTLDDPEKRPSIADYLGKIRERIFPVGRLDFNTSGVLLITNDGAMTQALLHPRKKVPKKYLAKFRGELRIEALDALRKGVTLDNGEKTGKSELFVRRQERGYTWVELTIYEGKNRQIHRMGEAIGHRVSQLSRIAFAGLTAQELRPGQYRKLKTREVDRLKRDYLNPAKRSQPRENKLTNKRTAKG